MENYIDLSPADIAGRGTHLRQLCMHTAISHTRLACSSQIFLRVMNYKKKFQPETIVKESLWVEANKPVSGKHKDPILTCSLCDQPCHAIIPHHHMSCMNTALAKDCLKAVIILEGIVKELLSTMRTLGRKKITEKFRKDMNEIANKLEDECESRSAIARITATSIRWKARVSTTMQALHL